MVDLPQSDGAVKKRLALLLRQMPRFNDWLLVGISTQLHQEVPGFDEILYDVMSRISLTPDYFSPL